MSVAPIRSGATACTLREKKPRRIRLDISTDLDCDLAWA
jgi:hypothetical protein